MFSLNGDGGRNDGNTCVGDVNADDAGDEVKEGGDEMML